MATFNADNYKGAYVDRPQKKIVMGELTGKKRVIVDRYTLNSVLVPNDEILMAFIPANSIVTGAKVKIDKSLGATGIFHVGYKDNGVDGVEDPIAFIDLADAGGQAVHKLEGLNNAGIFKRNAKDLQIFVKCFEVMEGTVLDGVITVEIEYVND